MIKITKLVRSLRSHLAATDHEAVNWPVVVLPWSYRTETWNLFEEWDQELVDALRSLHRIDELPLPFDPCVLVWENRYIVERQERPSWNAWPIASFNALPDGLSGFDFDPVAQFRAIGWWGTHWSYSPDRVAIARAPIASYKLKDGWASNNFQEWRSLKGCTAFWFPLVDRTDEPKLQRDPPGWMEPLARLMSPCGYLMRAAVHEPYGPPALRDDLWRDPFYTLVNWDRLYRETEGGCGTHAPPKPHHRRGYPRRQWKKAGIDRRTLPRRVKDRLRIAEARNVPIVMVRECVVRPAIYWSDGLAAYEEIDPGADNAFKLAEPRSE